MDSLLLLFIALLVGFVLGGLAWHLWGRKRAVEDQVSSIEEQIATDESLQLRLDELTVLHAIATVGAEATDEDVLIDRATQIM
jgi:hypothetical protein